MTMKPFLLTLPVLMTPMLAWSAPFLDADVDANTNSCDITGAPIQIPTVGGTSGVCTWDLTGVPAGQYTVSGTGKNVLGQAGPSSSFSFFLPSIPSAPSGWRLRP